MSIFEESYIASIKTPIILIVDASGSVLQKYTDGLCVFDKFLEEVKRLPCDSSRIIFWNSDNYQNDDFPNGVLRFPYVIARDKVSQLFAHVKVKIKNSCCTFPHLGFKAIDTQWLNNDEPTQIYFFTDGQMGFDRCSIFQLDNLKTQLKMEIENLFKTRNNVYLHMFCVENKNILFDNVEKLETIVGGDVFSVIQNNGLTKYITEFVSFTPHINDGYKHIKNLVVPPGYIPFGDQCFSEIKTTEFVGYLNNLIRSKRDDEDELLRIIQKLSFTIKCLSKDKPVFMTNSILNMFASMFENTVIDSSMTQFILIDAIKLEIEGKAIVYSQYRQKLKQLYKEAADLLAKNTKNAMGLTNEFITLPFDDKVIFGHNIWVTEYLRLGSTIYPYSSISIDKIKIPVLPLNTDNTSLLNQQCIRQFIRAIISNQYNVSQMDDIVIFIMLGINLKVSVSNVDETIKSAFRKLSTVMLNKKRLNSDITELSRLEEGNLPIPNNGVIEPFYDYMRVTGRILCVECEPMTLWYGLCLALENKKLISSQLYHCVTSIKKDFGAIKPENLIEKFKTVIKPIEVYELSFKHKLEYKCIITLEDTSNIGGYILNKHLSITDHLCFPMFVLSRTGYELLSKQPYMVCPQCFKRVSKTDFQEIDAKRSEVLHVFRENIVDPFKTEPTNLLNTETNVNKNQKEIVVLCMEGTIGSGKSTYSKKLQEKIELLGWHCINEGTDKYSNKGYQIGTAISMVKNKLKTIKKLSHNKICVIIDTCGQPARSDIIFDTDFSGSKIIYYSPNYDASREKGYLCWSLRNVLTRSMYNSNSLYFINPVTAGLKVCLDVHLKKARMFIGNHVNLVSYKNTLSDVLREIESEAKTYQSYLDQSKPIDDEIDRLIEQIIT